MAEAPDLDLLLGRLAVHYKILSKEQVADALQRQRALGGLDFADFLVADGLVAAETVHKLVGARDQYLARPAAEPAAATPAVTAPVAAAQPAVAAQPVVADAGSGTGDDLIRYRPGVTLDELAARAQRLGASDLHVHAGSPIKLRLHGDLRDVSPIIPREEAERLVRGFLGEELSARLDAEHQADFARAVPGVGRFRANAFRQQRGVDLVMRAIPERPPTLEQLGLPASLEGLVGFHQGIVLFTGPAGCGKSSTMAAMVDIVNRTRPDHILTIEDPIEYVHESKRCVVNQREVGPHTGSFARALRAALREDPDVIVIGELRDLETISLALTAAETGHLVLGTLHTSSAIRTINRLLGVFPPEQQAQIRMMVSESLRAVISQRLVPTADGKGRVLALELMINNKAIGNLIRDQKTFQIKSIMQTSAGAGMVLLDASLQELVTKRKITRESARRFAEDPKKFDEPKKAETATPA